jgi:hypothetical protein
MNVAGIVLLLLCLAPQATGTASIAGTVVDDEQRPVAVRRAVVTVAGPGLVPSRSAITDDEGRFTVERLPAGRFTITVSRASFITSVHGAKRPGKPGTPVVVDAGQRITGLTVKLWRGAVVAGVVKTEDGRPAEGLPVRVIAAHQTNEPSIFTLSNNGVKTNDAGEFRIFGLPPGSYLVSVTPPVLRGMAPSSVSEADMDAALAAMRARAPAPAAGRSTAASTTQTSGAPLATSRPFAYAAIYFPATPNMADARPIALVPGQIVEGIELQLQRVPTAAVGGIVTRADGSAAPGATIQMLQVPPSGYTLDAPLIVSATALPNGEFRIPAVSPGDYTLTVRATPPGVTPSSPFGGPALWSETKVSVNGSDIAGLALALQAGPALTGRVAFTEGALKPPADLKQWRVALATPASLTRRGPVMGSQFNPAPPVALNADGTFEISGIPPGAFLFQLTGPGLGPTGWWMRSMMDGDRDLLDRPMEIRAGSPSMNAVLLMSDKHTELSGTLRTSTGQPGLDVVVIAFSSDRAMWGSSARRVRAVRPDVDGHFSMLDLPPGDYLLGVVSDIDPENAQDPALLEQLAPSSIKVAIGEGEKKVQDLQMKSADLKVRTYAPEHQRTRAPAHRRTRI